MTSFNRTFIKYLSEVAIIFIGITISFWFENWREGRHEKQELRSLIVSLQADLKEKRKEIDDDVESVGRNIEVLDSCMNLVKAGHCDDKLLEELRFDLGNDHWLFNATTPTYETATSTGIWKVLPDSLKHQIYLLYTVDFRFLDVIVTKQSEYAAACKKDFMVETGMTDFDTMSERQRQQLCRSEKLYSYAGLIREQWKKIIRFDKQALTNLDKTQRSLASFVEKY